MLSVTLLLEFLSLVAATLIVVIAFFKKRYSYWRDHGVEYIEPTIPFGNFKDNFTRKTSFGDYFAKFYSIIKKHKVQYAGCYWLATPVFVPIDLDLIKRIMTTDFAHFTDHRTYVNEKVDPLSAHLFSLCGQKWRDLRVKLTPTFTTGKMKLMMPIMTKISEELISTLENESQKGPIDVKDISARFTTDVIGNCAFGIECNSLKDPNTEFRNKGKRLVNLTRFESIRVFLCLTFPNVMKFLGSRLLPKDASDFFWNVAKDTTDYRNREGVRRDDVLQLLIDMMHKEGEKTDFTLTFNELAAQALIFFGAGFETSSTLMSFALFELSQNEDIQNELRKEVTNLLRRNSGEITYESLTQTRFLDMVIYGQIISHTAMFAGTMLLQFFGVIAATFILLIAFFKRRYSYWKNRGIEYVEPTIPFGNFKDSFVGKTSFGDYFAEFYNTMKKRKVQHAGCYMMTDPIFVPINLDLIKRILTADFVHFTDHPIYVNEKDDPLSAHLFSLNGQRWRDLRVKLTPTFTSGKMKLMFPIMTKISRELIETLNKQYLKGPVDAKDISARFTTDVIGNCAFGIECNSLRDPNTEFRIKGKRLITRSRLENIIIFLGMTFPSLMRFLGAPFFPKEAAQFFWNVIKDTTQYREENGVRRNDALQLLIDMMRKDGDESDSGLSFSELAAQAVLFFVAGFETSSTLLSFALYELAVNEDHQNQLRKELNQILKDNNDGITYDCLSQMGFMDMVINETLRKYPPLSLLARVCTKDYQVPHSDITLHIGDVLFIPMKGIHYDPEYYPDPEKFDPFRFSEENKSKRHQFAFLPFGEGPRICIGLRFGLMQAKVGLATMIANFRFKLNPNTVTPLKMDPACVPTTALGGLWLDIEKIN